MDKLKNIIKNNESLYGIIFWINTTRFYKAILKKLKKHSYVIVVDTHVGHYMMTLSAIRVYKECKSIKKLGVIIDRRYSDMVNMWSEDIDDVIVVDDTSKLFRLNKYIYIHKFLFTKCDERIIPYYFGNGSYGMYKIFMTSHYKYINDNEARISDLATHNLSFGDVNVNSLLQLKLGQKLSIPCLKLKDEDIELFKSLNMPNGKGLLIIPSAQCSESLGVSLLRKITATASKSGLKVYLNCSKGEKPFDDSVTPLSLDITQTLKASVYLGHVVASQSGLIDTLLMARFKNMKIITYLGNKYDKRLGYFIEHQNTMLKETGMSSDIYINIDINDPIDEDEIVRKVFKGWE